MVFEDVHKEAKHLNDFSDRGFNHGQESEHPLQKQASDLLSTPHAEWRNTLLAQNDVSDREAKFDGSFHDVYGKDLKIEPKNDSEPSDGPHVHDVARDAQGREYEVTYAGKGEPTSVREIIDDPPPILPMPVFPDLNQS
jgi:hypothetical protein